MSDKPAALEGHAATDALPAIVNTQEAQEADRVIALLDSFKAAAKQPAEHAESRAVGTTADTSGEVTPEAARKALNTIEYMFQKATKWSEGFEDFMREEGGWDALETLEEFVDAARRGAA